jgi:hypothetical protein
VSPAGKEGPGGRRLLLVDDNSDYVDSLARVLQRAAILIALTGWGPPHDGRAAKEAGFDDCLVKPVEVEQIERVLQAVTR